MCQAWFSNVLWAELALIQFQIWEIQVSLRGILVSMSISTKCCEQSDFRDDKTYLDV